uniref:GAGE domain-containing protein n=2 Tax=Sus scrofa TaxID=9823 RepID=A0A8D1QIY4_PIG
MSGHVRSRSIPEGRQDDQESYQPYSNAQQPSDEQPQQEEPPSKSQDITPDQEKEDGGAPVVQGSDLETDLQKPAPTKTEGRGRDNPAVREEIPLCSEPIRVLEGGEGEPQV